MQNENESRRIIMVCESEEVRADASEMFKRVSSALSAVDSFHDKMCELDEDAPDLEQKVAPLLNRLTLTLMQIYPDARQMTQDIKSIGDFRVLAAIIKEK